MITNSPRIPGQRDPELTRRAILDAATAEFVENGFAGASVNEIAARANVNKRMLYHYFGKKDELYLTILERVYAALRVAQGGLKLADVAPTLAIEELIRFTWKYYMEHPELLSLMATENMLGAKNASRSDRFREANAPLTDLLRDVVDRGKSDGVFRQDVEPLDLYLTIAALGTFFVSASKTLSPLAGRDLTTPEAHDARLKHTIDVVLGYLRP